MIEMILGWLGIGGIAASLIVAVLFFTGYLPQVVVKMITGAVEAVLSGIAWFFEKIVFGGTQRIFSNWQSAGAFFFFLLVAGTIGDKYDPYRSVVEWQPASRAEAAATPRYGSSKKAKSKTQTKTATPVDYVRRSLGL
jgi:hypothetical protein